MGYLRMKVEIDLTQVQGEVRRGNKYRNLLEKCLEALNDTPSFAFKDSNNYKLAKEIEKTFKEVNNE